MIITVIAFYKLVRWLVAVVGGAAVVGPNSWCIYLSHRFAVVFNQNADRRRKKDGIYIVRSLLQQQVPSPSTHRIRTQWRSHCIWYALWTTSRGKNVGFLFVVVFFCRLPYHLRHLPGSGLLAALTIFHRNNFFLPYFFLSCSFSPSLLC